MTTKGRNIPTRIEVKHNKKTGWVVMDQIRTIDKRRIIKRVGHLTNEETKKCKWVIKETFVD